MNTPYRFLLTTAAVALLTECSGGSTIPLDAGGPDVNIDARGPDVVQDTREPDAFPGTYTGQATETVTKTSPTSSSSSGVSAEEDVITAGSTVDLVVTRHQTTLHCVLNANRTGATSATFVSGQICNYDNGMGGSLQLTLNSGTATLNGAVLSMTFSWNFSGSIDGTAVTGTLGESIQSTKH